MKAKKTKKRKLEHIQLCLKKDVEFEEKQTGFSDLEFIHEAVPETSYEKIDTETMFLGKKLATPLIISSMTGGCEEGKKINKDLAHFAEKKQIAFSVGSMRAMLENKKLANTYQVRDVAPKTLVLGNIGAYQLKAYEPEEITDAMETIQADAYWVHLNAAQEALQREGDKNWENILEKLRTLCRESKLGVLVKETGCGISMETASELEKTGIQAIDVAGAGGTSWTKIEQLRHPKITDVFQEWGIPTVASLVETVVTVKIPVVASGGVRTGVDIAKSIRLGAAATGIALGFLRAWSKKSLATYYDYLETELKTTMMLTGSKNLEQLRNTSLLISGETATWLETRGIDTTVFSKKAGKEAEKKHLHYV